MRLIGLLRFSISSFREQIAFVYVGLFGCSVLCSDELFGLMNAKIYR